MRTTLLSLCTAVVLCACGTPAGTPVDPNGTRAVPGDGNSVNGNNTGTGSAGNSVVGTVQGHGLVAKSAIYAVGMVPGDANSVMPGQNSNIDVLTLVVSDQLDPCAAITANKHTKNSTTLTFALLKGDSTGASVPPTSGTYSLSSTGATSLMAGQAELFAYDAACATTVPDDNATVSTGTVSVTSSIVDGTAPLVGTFDLTVGAQGDKVTGTFNATSCPALIAVAGGASSLGACQ